MPTTSLFEQRHTRSDAFEYIRKVHKMPYQENYQQLTFPIFADDEVEDCMTSVSGRRALNQAITHHLTKVKAETMSDASAAHETWIDWDPAHKGREVIMSLTSTLGNDRVHTVVPFCMDTDNDIPSRFDADEAPSEILSKVLYFEPGAQRAISLFSENWDEAADSVLDTLAAEGFDVPFTDCEQFSGRVGLMGAKGNTTDLSIRIELPTRRLCWTFVDGALLDCPP